VTDFHRPCADSVTIAPELDSDLVVSVRPDQQPDFITDGLLRVAVRDRHAATIANLVGRKVDREMGDLSTSARGVGSGAKTSDRTGRLPPPGRMVVTASGPGAAPTARDRGRHPGRGALMANDIRVNCNRGGQR